MDQRSRFDSGSLTKIPPPAGSRANPAAGTSTRGKSSSAHTALLPFYLFRADLSPPGRPAGWRRVHLRENGSGGLTRLVEEDGQCSDDGSPRCSPAPWGWASGPA